MSEIKTVRRAHWLIASIEADNVDALVYRLHSLAAGINRGEITVGVSGGTDSGMIYSYKHDPAMTHDAYFVEIDRKLKEDTAVTASQAPEGER